MSGKFPINPSFGITFILLIMSFLPVVVMADGTARNGATARLFGHPVERVKGTVAQHDFEPGELEIKRAMVAETQKTSNGGGFQTDVNSQAQTTFGTWFQSGHSGAWFNSSQDGHGLFVEVLADATSPTGMKVLIAWYAFLNGQQVWILAVGPVTEEGYKHFAVMDALIFTGGDFPPFFDSATIVQEAWGTITLQFNGCNAADLSWTTSSAGFTSGQLSLERLTFILDSVCDPDLGGDQLSDDHGNTWQTGTALSTGKAVVGSIEVDGDVDVFALSRTASYWARFRLLRLGETPLRSAPGISFPGKLFRNLVTT